MQDDESEISHTRLAYLPALDGMRAAAVFAVMMFHGGISFMNGGFMGVDAFFVLSGFLITSLLVGEWRQTMTIKLASFWARRARRLLPALLLMLLFVAFFASVIVPEGTYGALRLDALSTLLYVSNWHFILVGSNYFNETASASPLIHTWSLAVEEQFYLIWPLVVLAVLHFTKSLKVLLGVCVAAGVASAVEMAVLYDPTDVNRVYLGTDTRAQCLFIGCALAVALVIITQRHHEEGGLAAGQLWRPGLAAGPRRVRRGRHRWSDRGDPHLGADRRDLVLPLLGRLLPRRPVHRLGHPGRRRARHAAWCRASSRSPPCATSAAFRTASTSGTGHSSSGSTTSAPGSTATRSSSCGCWPRWSSPRSPSTWSSGRSAWAPSCASGGPGWPCPWPSSWWWPR